MPVRPADRLERLAREISALMQGEVLFPADGRGVSREGTLYRVDGCGELLTAREAAVVLATPCVQ